MLFSMDALVNFEAPVSYPQKLRGRTEGMGSNFEIELLL